MASDSVAPLLLSRPLEDRMPVYPGDPGVRIRPALTVAQDGVAVMALEIGSHAGTHVDAPCHTVPGGRTVEGLTWDELCGDTLVLGLAGVAAAHRRCAILAARSWVSCRSRARSADLAAASAANAARSAGAVCATGRSAFQRISVPVLWLRM